MTTSTLETTLHELVQRELVEPIKQAAEMFVQRVAAKCEALTPLQLAQLRRELAGMRQAITKIEPQHTEYEEGDHG